MSTYSFLDVQATFVGPPAFAFDMGYGAAIAEEGISIEPTEDKNTMLIGADGEGMHSLHAGKPVTVTVRTLKTSPLNQQLMLAYNAQTEATSLHGQNVMTVRNADAGDLTVVRQAAFKKKPTIKYAKDGDVMEWAFDGIKGDSTLGTY